MKKQSQKNRPARGAKNTDRAAVILSLFREFPNNKFSLKHLASASGGATKEGRRETFEILGRLHDEGIVEECAREKYRLTHKHLPHFEGIAGRTAKRSWSASPTGPKAAKAPWASWSNGSAWRATTTRRCTPFWPNTSCPTASTPK